jgi:drug/metabolite transporter (DMT)-like permease
VAIEDGLSPAFVAWSRVAIGAAVLLPFAWQVGALHGLGRRWKSLLAFAFVEITIPFPFIAAGEQYVSSSLAAILIAALPLVVTVVALRFDPSERATGSRLAGMVIGLAGVVALLGIDVVGRPDELLGAGFILTATIGYAIGPMIVKHHLSDGDPRGPVAAALGIASLLLLPAAALSPPDAVPSSDAIGAIVVLGVACSALTFVIFFALIAEAGPSRATIIAYVNPVIAVGLGVALLDERPGPGAVAGLLLILAGSWLSTGGRLPPSLEGVLARRAAVAAERRQAAPEPR